MVPVVEILGEGQDLPVALRGGPHNHLGGLARRGEPGGVAVQLELPPGGGDAIPNLSHRDKNVLLLFVRGQEGQAFGAGKLDIYAHPVGQQAQPVGEPGVRPGDGLGVDVSPEAVLLPKQAQGLDHPLGGVVRVPEDGGGEKQPLDIVAPVEAHGELAQLPGGEGRPGHVVGPAVHTVGAVVGAYIGHQHLQQGDAPAVGGKGVAAAGKGGAAHRPRPSGPVQAAGGAGGVILGRVRQNFQFVHQLHRGPPP